MQKFYLYSLLIFVIFIAGCNNTEKVDVSSKEDIDGLLEEAEQFIEKDDYENAIIKYEEVIQITNDSQYQSKVEELEELKVKQDKDERDIEIVNVTIEQLKNVLKNPDSLKINEIIIYRSNGDLDWATVYMDYSAMNGFGGYNREYAYAAFNNQILQEGSFFPEFESNYRSAEEAIKNNEPETYYFDLNLIDKLN